MEQTLAGMTSEVERLVKPLGFKIEAVRREEKSSSPLMLSLAGLDTQIDADDGELTISIVRKGNLG